MSTRLADVPDETLEQAAVQLEYANAVPEEPIDALAHEQLDYNPIIDYLRATKADCEKTKRVIDDAWDEL